MEEKEKAKELNLSLARFCMRGTYGAYPKKISSLQQMDDLLPERTLRVACDNNTIMIRYKEIYFTKHYNEEDASSIVSIRSFGEELTKWLEQYEKLFDVALCSTINTTPEMIISAGIYRYNNERKDGQLDRFYILEGNRPSGTLSEYQISESDKAMIQRIVNSVIDQDRALFHKECFIRKITMDIDLDTGEIQQHFIMKQF